MENYLRLENISKYYKVNKSINFFKKKNVYIRATNNVSFDLNRGEILGLIGESGCGKSTIAKIIVNLEKPDYGNIYIEGVSIENILKNDYKKFRRDIQMIFQNPYDSFTPRDTIEKILMRVLKIHNIGSNYEDRKKILIENLEKGGLKPAEEILKRYPHQLSGGQLQRVSIIRAMLLEPKLLIADEPVSMLDMSVRADIINMLYDLAKKKQTSVIFISHDIALTRYISDKVAVMYFGNIVEFGNTDDVIQNPLHPYTKVLISNTGNVDPDNKKEKKYLKNDYSNIVEIVNDTLSNYNSKFNDLIEVEKNHYVRKDEMYRKES